MRNRIKSFREYAAKINRKTGGNIPLQNVEDQNEEDSQEQEQEQEQGEEQGQDQVQDQGQEQEQIQ